MIINKFFKEIFSVKLRLDVFKFNFAYTALLSLLFFGLNSSYAQSFENGVPNILNYTKKNHQGHDQNWCMTQDSLGIIYIGNRIGLLVFDGIEIDFIDCEGGAIQSLNKDKKGKIYYASEKDFGFLELNKFGKITLHSLKALLPKENSVFSSVWTVEIIENEVFFHTKEHIFVYSNNKIKVLNPIRGSGFHKCFNLDGTFVVREIEGGITYYKNGKLCFIKGSEYFSEIKIDFLKEVNNKILIGTRNNGFFEIIWDKKNNPNECKVLPLKFPCQEFFKNGELYCGLLLSNGNIALATLKSGIGIIDPNGNLLEVFNNENGLVDDKVWSLMEDKNHNLWSTSNKGFSMIDYLIPIRLYNSLQGVTEPIYEVVFLNKKLWISSVAGLYTGEHSSKGIIFKKIPSINFPCNSISNFKNTISEEYIISCKEGLFSLIGEHLNTIESGMEFYSSLFSSHHSNILVAAGENLITIYQKVDGKYNLINEFEINSQLRTIIEDSIGNIWVSGTNNTLVKISFEKNNPTKTKIKSYEIKIKDVLRENHIFNFKNKINLCSNNGIYELKETNNELSFVKSEQFDEEFQKKENENYVFKTFFDKKNNLWMIFDTKIKNGNIGFFDNNNRNKKVENNIFFNKYQGIQKNSFCEDENKNIWIATNDGLLKFNTRIPYSYKYKFPVFFKQITFKNDSTYNCERGIFPKKFSEKYPFSNNGVSFKFSAANFSKTEDLFFSTKLSPVENEFSEWSTKTNLDYNYLPEGIYTIEVKAKDIFNNISDTKSFTFEIAPPWYRTNIAYILYLLFGAWGIYLLVKFNTKRLRNANELLENTVKDRTHELWEERDKLKQANLEITDSIKYAQIIQNSILPSVDKFKSAFNDSFIFFKPRNIVSGDFYWFNLENKFSSDNKGFNKNIIVCADCTGHGVPGAFMSMIGSEKLNQAIVEINNPNTGEILSFMNKQIKSSLKQGESVSQSKDGMEIGMCIIDKQTNSVLFSGANRPLWIFRSGKSIEELEVLKPTKAGIAGHTSNDQKFEEVQIFLNNGDTLYMFTDGAPDQFGGEKGKKLTTKGLREMLFSIQHLNLDDQYLYIENFYKNWMGNEEQVDDILMIGIRF